jgi:predicted transcriptional regulator
MARAPELERRVTDLLWEGGAWSVRSVREAIGGSLAHTTIATVLDRLHAKGVVERTKDGPAWSYRAARTREAAIGAEVARMLERVDAAPEPLLVAFLDQVEQVDPEALDRLEALLRARRQKP